MSNTNTMINYDDHFKKALVFINEYKELINCHLVDFITENLWNKCVPWKLRLELEENDVHCVNWTQGNNNVELNKYIELAKSLSLESCSTIADIKDFSKVFQIDFNDHGVLNDNIVNTKVEFMKAKKQHEVEALGNIIAKLAKLSDGLVIDAGAGKAYLSTYLSENHRVPVLAIDSSSVCHKGAVYRQKTMRKKNKHPQSLIRYVVENINDKTDYVDIVKQNFNDWCLNKSLILTGLHTCGGLVHSIIRRFLATKEINFLCIVPCCYHLTNEILSNKCNFSKNARMLAQQCLEKSMLNKCLIPSLFYRAILEVFLHSIGMKNIKVGRGGPLDDFVSYAKWSLLKVGVSNTKVPSDAELHRIYESCLPLKKKFEMFQMLRIHASCVVEAAIMLDRLIFLEGSKECSKVVALRLFDPRLSPRRYAIIAAK